MLIYTLLERQSDFHLSFVEKEVRYYQSRLNYAIGIVIIKYNVTNESMFLISPGRYSCPRPTVRELLLYDHPLTVKTEQ